MIEKLYTNLLRSELCVCGFIDKFDKKEKSVLTPFETGGEKNRNKYLQTMSQYLYSVYFGAAWNKLYITKIIKSNNISFRKDISYAEDLIFNLKSIVLLHNKQFMRYLLSIF